MATLPMIPTFNVRVGVPVHAISLSADGQRVAAATEGGIYVYDHEGRQKFAYYAPEFPFTAVALTPAGGTLAATSRDGYLYAFDLLRDLSVVPYESLRLFSAPKDLRSLSITTDGRRLAVGHVGERVTLLGRDGKIVWSWQSQFKGWHVAMKSGGEQLAVASLGSPVNAIVLLDGETGQPCKNPFRTSQRITALALLPEDRGVVAAVGDGKYENTLYLFSGDLAQRVGAYDLPCAATAAAVDGQGRYLAIGGSDGGLYLFDLQARILIGQHGPMEAPVSGVALTPDGLHLGMASGSHIYLLRNELIVPPVSPDAG